MNGERGVHTVASEIALTLKPQRSIKDKLLLPISSQQCVVQYGEFGRWSLVGHKVSLTINSPNTVHTFCSGQGRAKCYMMEEMWESWMSVQSVQTTFDQDWNGFIWSFVNFTMFVWCWQKYLGFFLCFALLWFSFPILCLVQKKNIQQWYKSEVPDFDRFQSAQDKIRICYNYWYTYLSSSLFMLMLCACLYIYVCMCVCVCM